MGFNVKPPSHAYVETKTGIVDANTVKVKKTTIVVDEAKYPKTDVISFSDGKNFFRPISEKKSRTYAMQMYEGDINVFKVSELTSSSNSYNSMSGTWSSSSGGGAKTHTVTHYYLQKTGSPELFACKYKYLKPMILPNEPAYKYLQTYERKRRQARLVTYGGIAAIAAGIAITSNSDSKLALYTFGVGLFGGVGAIWTGMIKSFRAPRYLTKTLGVHNGSCKNKKG